MSLLSCQGGQVNHDGDYAFLPGAPVADTNAHPLRHLLLVETDEASGLSLFYYFRGDLGAAGTGLSDLRRIEASHDRFRLLFSFPLRHYTEVAGAPAPSGEAGAGGAPAVLERTTSAGGSRSATAEGAAGAYGFDSSLSSRALELEVGVETVVLWPLDSESLVRVGASRFVSLLTSGQWSMQAYFGVLESGQLPDDLVMELDGTPVRYRPWLAEPQRLEFDGREQSLLVEHELGSAADYVELDLYQAVTREVDAASLQTILRVSTTPGSRVEYAAGLLDYSFNAACWSRRRPLRLRLTQVARGYLMRRRGDLAVEMRYHTQRELPEALWGELVSERRSPDYCALYE